MKRIHEFDTALREAFERGDHDRGVVFIQKDTQNRIIPCSPNKILLSSTTTLKPSVRMLPTGFKVKAKSNIKKQIGEIDSMIAAHSKGDDSRAFLMPVKDAMRVIELVSETFVEGHDWDVAAYLAGMEYLSQQSVTNKDLEGNVWVLVRRDREAQRTKKDGRFENSPDSYQEKGQARRLAEEVPALILLRQKGEESAGWSGTPFWWPVLVTPSNTKTVVFSSEQVGVEE